MSYVPGDSAESQCAAATSDFSDILDHKSSRFIFKTRTAGDPLKLEQRLVIDLDARLSQVLGQLAGIWQLGSGDGLCITVTPPKHAMDLLPALIFTEYEWRLFTQIALYVFRADPPKNPFILWTCVINRAPKLLARDQIAFAGSENEAAASEGDHKERSDEDRSKSQSDASATSAASAPQAQAAPPAAAAEPRTAPQSQTPGQAQGSPPVPSIPSLQAALVNCAPPALAPLISPLLDFAMALTGTPRPLHVAGGSQQSSMQARGAASSPSAPTTAASSTAPAASENAAPSAPAQGAATGSAAPASSTDSAAPPSFDELMARCRAQGEAQGRAFGDLAAARAERLGRPRAPSPEPQAPAELQTGPGSTAGSDAFEVVEHEASSSNASSAPAPQLSERVVKTNTALSSAWEERLAQMGHSGLSRAQRMEQEREAARRFEERQRAMMEQMEREEAEEAARAAAADSNTDDKGKGKAEPAAEQAAPKPNVADTNASLASGFEAMLQQMRSARAESTYAPYRSKRQQAAAPSAAQPAAAEAQSTPAEASTAAPAEAAAAPAPEKSEATTGLSQQGQQMNQQLSSAFEEMLKAARGG